VSYVPDVANFSVLSIIDCHLGFLEEINISNYYLLFLRTSTSVTNVLYFIVYLVVSFVYILSQQTKQNTNSCIAITFAAHAMYNGT
jgi:hypothetical protein